MNRLVLALTLFVISGLSSGCDADKVARLEKQNQELQAQMQKQRTAINFDFQERCAEQARKTFNDLGYKEKDFASYENHYNENLNKCFIEITDTEPGATGTIFTTKTVSDALEGKTYGQYVWGSNKVKKFWEVPPIVCNITLPSGEQRKCKSDDEFKELLKPYMDIS